MEPDIFPLFFLLFILLLSTDHEHSFFFGPGVSTPLIGNKFHLSLHVGAAPLGTAGWQVRKLACSIETP